MIVDKTERVCPLFRQTDGGLSVLSMQLGSPVSTYLSRFHWAHLWGTGELARRAGSLVTGFAIIFWVAGFWQWANRFGRGARCWTKDWWSMS